MAGPGESLRQDSGIPARFALVLVAAALATGCLSSFHGSQRFESLETKLLAAVNAEREKAGLQALRSDKRLANVAWEHSRDMARSGKLDHHGRDGSLVGRRLDRQGIAWAEAGENVARNRGFEDPAQEAVRAWMESEDHRRNILNAHFAATGVAVAREPGSGAVFITQVFILPMP